MNEPRVHIYRTNGIPSRVVVTDGEQEIEVPVTGLTYAFYMEQADKGSLTLSGVDFRFFEDDAE